MFKWFASLFAVVLFLAAPMTTQAYETWDKYHLEKGVGSYGKNKRYYFVHSSAKTYNSFIQGAWSDWINTTKRLGISTPISFRETTNRSNSVVDITTFSGKKADGYAVVQHYDFGDTGEGPEYVDPWEENWDYAEIKINVPEYNKLSSYNKKGTIAHEIGHTMGLAHTMTATSVMTQIGQGRKVDSAQVDDLAGINYLY
ncbi:hypothetical protein J2Z48_000784 [Croceifilum oryzae]|uniref:Peptidase M10 metallopeptidase domain-containing protein n=1 Tax=Croceifilum oryzae TaxID=1553429 RepID=A0AAJ1TGI9_9BACL|nr:matrixin family metalloprotease [Croceifilum oryzae]MDQ0416617.1 hypothetical protein [Croceifilum oryzae]